MTRNHPRFPRSSRRSGASGAPLAGLAVLAALAVGAAGPAFAEPKHEPADRFAETAQANTAREKTAQEKTAQTSPENARWFVLRREKTSDCWAGVLIQVDGDYQHSFALIAGGPYATKADALAREKELEDQGSCKTAS